MNSAARIVTNTRKYDYITPILQKLHWLPVRQRIPFKILLITDKYIHDMASIRKPSPKISHLVRYCYRCLGLGSSHMVIVYLVLQTTHPPLWNRLLADVRNAKILNLFFYRYIIRGIIILHIVWTEPLNGSC